MQRRPVFTIRVTYLYTITGSNPGVFSVAMGIAQLHACSPWVSISSTETRGRWYIRVLADHEPLLRLEAALRVRSIPYTKRAIH